VIEDPNGTICHDKTSEGGAGARLCEEQQSSMMASETCALAVNLMERICNKTNLNRAYKRVKANKGSPGVDGMSVTDLGGYLRNHKEQLIQSLLDGSYKPQPIRKVMIPKPGGDERQLGIPTVVDRVIQQAILQILEPI
jgi:RNA-directed DNA polymerase